MRDDQLYLLMANIALFLSFLAECQSKLFLILIGIFWTFGYFKINKIYRRKLTMDDMIKEVNEGDKE